MSPNAALATSGCGCGCGDCGGSGTVGADGCATAFVRPRFFAGQLLTEDDLGALTTYITAKDRLHNRYLFGAGVVCGLWVSCDPCGGGTVTVQPGYALDCCGNDLVLACATTLNINAMVRDLRARMGTDCGDPCSDKSKQSAAAQQGAVTRRYCLYARYGEEATDPVAPYATEEPCGQTTCEPTRVREGTSFILSCPGQEPPAPNLWRRLKKCFPPQDILGGAARLTTYGAPMIAAAEATRRPVTFGEQDGDDLRDLLARLGEEPYEVGTGRARPATETLRAFAAVLARYELAKDRPQLGELPQARHAIRGIAAALRETVEATWDDPLDRAAVGALLDQATLLADSGVAQPASQLAMLAQGRPLDDSVLSLLRWGATALQEWLLARVDSDLSLADCELRSKLAALSVTTAATVDEAALRAVGRASSDLIEFFTRYLTGCICAALNPPCGPCENTDVLLACLEVRDCEVVRICNAERDYVVSGSALRYWLPTWLLHEQIECFCCQDRPKCLPADREPGELSFQETGFGAAEPAADVPWELVGLRQPADLLHGVLRQADISLRAPAAPEAFHAPPVPAPPAPAADTAASDAAAQQLTALTEQVTQLASKLTGTEDRLAETRARLTDTETQLADTRTRLTTLANRPPARPSPASRARRTAGPKSQADTQEPPATPGTGTTGPGSPEASAASTTGPGSPEVPGASATGPGSPEAGDGT
jgi:hypothetical protein